MGLREAADAIDAVDEHYGHAYGEGEYGVEFEFVKIAYNKQVNDYQFERDVEDFDVCVYVHLLVSDDAGVVRGLGDA